MPNTERQIGDLTGPAYACPICKDELPDWVLVRIGDVATSWACDDHLVEVAELMQRDHEITRLEIRIYPKVKEWAELDAALRTGDFGA